MTSTMAIWAFLAILSGYLVWVQLRSITRFNRQQEAINRLVFDNSVNKPDIRALYYRVKNQEVAISKYLALALRVHECEQKLDALAAAHNGPTAAIDYLAAGPLDTSALVLDHLGLEIQEPTTVTTPRRLVPKGKGGEE